MSGPPDLVGSIQPLAEPPPDKADPKTEAEEKDLKARASTPTEKLHESHGDHLNSLKQQAASLASEKMELDRRVVALTERLDTRVAALTERLEEERRRAESIAVDFGKLKASTSSVSCLSGLSNIAGTLMTIAGSISLGIAGSDPGLFGGTDPVRTEQWKHWLTAGGAVAAVCGGALVLISFVGGLVGQRNSR